MLAEHYRPKPAIVVERLKFHSTTRHSTKTVSSSEFCDFGSSLDEMLRDRLICGIKNPKIQKLLLTEPTLDFKKAQALAKSAEAAEKSIRDVTSPSPGVQLNAVYRGKPSNFKPSRNVTTEPNRTCFRCGAQHHPNSCRFKNYSCNYCHKKGHIVKVCRSRLWNECRGQRNLNSQLNIMQTCSKQTHLCLQL